MSLNDSHYRTVTTVRYFSYNYVIIPLLKCRNVDSKAAIEINQIKNEVSFKHSRKNFR